MEERNQGGKRLGEMNHSELWEAKLAAVENENLGKAAHIQSMMDDMEEA